jgi:hypothetical protein
VKAVAKAGRFAREEDLARAIDDALKRGWALADIGAAQAAAGHDREAVRLFRQAADGAAGLGAPAVVSVVQIVAGAGHVDEAERLAATIGDTHNRAEVQGRIAIAAAGTGRFEQALRLIDGIPASQAYARTLAIPELVAIVARTGVNGRQPALIARAVELAALDPARNMEAYRAKALAAIAEALAKNGP